MTSAAASPGARPPADTLIGRTLASDVLHRLRADITACALAPGERLRFQDLRRRYGVSFGTLREALAHLAAEGLVVAEGQRGFRVAPASRAGLRDLLEVLVLIERRALALAIRHGDAAWEAALRASLDRLERECGHAPEWEARHQAFHAALLAACGSPILLELRAMLHERWQRYCRMAVLQGARMPAGPDPHRALAEAALARDAPRALDLIEAHLRAAAASVLAHAGEALPEGGG